MSAERRETNRYPFQSKARIAFEDRRVLDVVSVNVSDGGIAFRCPEFISKGTLLKLELIFYHKSKPVKIRSVSKVIFNVTLADNQGVMTGVTFAKIADEDKQRLDVLLDRLKSQ